MEDIICAVKSNITGFKKTIVDSAFVLNINETDYIKVETSITKKVKVKTRFFIPYKEDVFVHKTRVLVNVFDGFSHNQKEYLIDDNWELFNLISKEVSDKKERVVKEFLDKLCDDKSR